MRGSNVLVPEIPLGGQDDGRVREWPLRTFLELGALPGAVPCARLHARQVLWEWSLTPCQDSVELVVSELVTNGIAAAAVTRVPVVRMWLLSDRTQVLVLIWDPSPAWPVRAEVDDEAESGRGLLLVEALCTQWSCYAPTNGAQGKVTWALIPAGG